MEASPKQNRIDAIGMYTSDAAALRTYLMSQGQKPAEVVTDAHGHTSFQVKDPEGHTIQFIQQPSGLGGSVSGTPPLSIRIIHAGFVVKDRAAVDHFYKDILGFRLYWSGGMKEGETNWVAMQVPDGTDWVEYMLNVPENADKRYAGSDESYFAGSAERDGRERTVGEGWRCAGSGRTAEDWAGW